MFFKPDKVMDRIMKSNPKCTPLSRSLRDDIGNSMKAERIMKSKFEGISASHTTPKNTVDSMDRNTLIGIESKRNNRIEEANKEEEEIKLEIERIKILEEKKRELQQLIKEPDIATPKSSISSIDILTPSPPSEDIVYLPLRLSLHPLNSRTKQFQRKTPYDYKSSDENVDLNAGEFSGTTQLSFYHTHNKIIPKYSPKAIEEFSGRDSARSIPPKIASDRKVFKVVYHGEF